MEDKRLTYIILGVALILMVAAYGVGFFVGKSSGIAYERRICEQEKLVLRRTLLRMRPTSRPQSTPPQKKTTTAAQQPAKPQTQPQTQTVAANQPKAKPQPQPQQQQQVSVQPQQQTSGRYYLQVGVFKNPENAQKLAGKLISNGFNAIVVQSGKYHKVIVGYFATQQQAYQTFTKLSSLGIKEAIVKKRSQ